MAENEKKFLDADGLKHFWEMCRLQSDEDFQTNLEIFDAMASALEKLKEDVGMPEDPKPNKNLFDLVTSNHNQSIIALNCDYEKGIVEYWTGDGQRYTFDIVDKDTTYKLATDKESGLVKLYAITGNAEDGTMTQKAISDELKKKVGVKLEKNMLVFTTE